LLWTGVYTVTGTDRYDSNVIVRYAVLQMTVMRCRRRRSLNGSTSISLR